MKKLFTLVCAAVCSICMMAAGAVKVGTYSTQTISDDWTTSTWAFPTASSNVDIPLLTKENDFIYSASSLGKMRIGTSKFSWSGQSNGYIYVPEGAAGTVSITTSSSSDSRYLQLYVNGTAAADSKRLWSKYNETPTSDGKKGPQSFAFTASDLTTKGDSTFLHFRDNNTEMKIASFTIVLTSGSYADCTLPTTSLTLSSNAAATVYVGDVITFSTTGGNGGTVTVAGDDKETISDNKWTATVGEHTFTATQPKTGDYCATESNELAITVLQKTPVTAVTIDGPTAGYKGNEATYTATAANATAYRWKVNGTVQEGAEAATFSYTPTALGTYSIVCEARNEFNKTDETPTWIASTPISLTASALYGTLIAATAETDDKNNINKDITATGKIGGTVHQNTQKNAKLGGSGQYFSLTLVSGTFNEGDTVKIVVTPEYNSEKETYSAPAVLKISTTVDNTNLIGESETKTIDPASSVDLTYDIVLTEGASTIYLARDASICKQNPVVKSISVIRPVDVKSTVETLTAVTINDVAISSSDLNKLVSGSSHTLILDDSYLNAPVVKFTKHTVITYEDESTKESDEVIEKTSSQATGSTWGASATIGNNSYTVYTQKTASYVVTYKLGTKTLGTENVVQNGSPLNYATYQTLNDGNLSTFKAWYTDADLAEAHKVANIAAAVITEATTFYAEFEYKYATSINIESSILEKGKNFGTKGALGTHNFASNYASEGMDVSNDSLDNSKGENRNYAYLGLKVKSASLLNFRLAEGKTVKIKLGNVGTTPKVSINGGDYATISLTDGVYTHVAEAEELISFWVTENNKAVVIKQIVIGNEPELEDVVYAINCADATNGTVSCSWALALPKEMVALTVTPASGYVVSSVKVNNAPIEADAQGKYSFQMPAADANVAATFSVATAVDNTDDAVKATKRIVNGQLIIEKNGEVYNVLGARVR